MNSGIDPKVDYAFKKLLGSESSSELLISFLNAVLDPPATARIQSVEILNPFQAQETDTDKLSILDIKARDQSGRLFNIEMQLLAAPYMRERILYYWARLFEDQLHASDDYRELCPTVSVCICDFTLFPQTKRHHLTFRLTQTQERIDFSDRMELHTLELEKFLAGETSLDSELDCWLYFLRNAPALEQDSLPPQLKRPVFAQALGVLEMIQQNRHEHELYEARLKAQLDENARRNIVAMYEQEIKERVAKGRDEGRVEGLRGQVQLLERFLKLRATDPEALEQLTLNQLQARIDELQAKWNSASPPN